MGKTALLFSGQGSQYVGMGREFTECFPELKIIFEKGSDILGFDLQKTINTASEHELAKTTAAQPAVYAVSLIALESLKKSVEGFSFQITAGHSLGEYAALTAAGIFDAESGFKLIKARSLAMSRASEGGMAAVLSSDTEMIEQVCDDVTRGGDYAAAVNYNSPQQTVIAGTASGLEKAASLLSEKGVRRIVKLNVSAAFHSALMKEASEEFKENASSLNIKFNKPAVDFYSNVYGKKLGISENSSAFWIDYLARHIVSPVLFTSELRAIRDDGAVTFAETGPGKILTGLVKKTLENIKTVNIEDIKSLETAKEIFS